MKFTPKPVTDHGPDIDRVIAKYQRPHLSEQESIHNFARYFTVAAIGCGVIGLLFLISAFIESMAMNSWAAFAIIGGSFISVSIWLILVAQVIHIRANTLK